LSELRQPQSKTPPTSPGPAPGDGR
jgi:hypothetical protein